MAMLIGESGSFVPMLSDCVADNVGRMDSPPMETEKKPLILIVDDVEPVRVLIQHALGAAGYATLSAEDGGNGLQLCRRWPPDLVITDLIMPGQQGFETISALRQQYPNVPIIAISGAIMGDLRQEAIALGADAALPKPINLRELLATVERLLTRSSAA